VDRRQRAALEIKIDGEVSDLKERGGHFLFWILDFGFWIVSDHKITHRPSPNLVAASQSITLFAKDGGGEIFRVNVSTMAMSLSNIFLAGSYR
jgi:hypothetical protein